VGEKVREGKEKERLSSKGYRNGVMALQVGRGQEGESTSIVLNEKKTV